jgi:serine/threonine protein kinase
MKRDKPIQLETAFRKYTRGPLLGEGGAGHVYHATDDSGGVHAIKILRAEGAPSEKRKRFQNEIRFCSGHDHAHVLSVTDTGVYTTGSSSAPFYVMSLYSSSLRYLLKQGVQPNQVLPLFTQILNGVEAAHLQKVIHRDLKPENILYDAERKRLVVADFGIAHFEEEELYTAVETRDALRMANFQYAAPEQRTRGGIVDHRADIFALGLMLNEMFTGDVPHGTGYKPIAAAAPPYAYLDELVAAMLRQVPSERPLSIAKIKDELIARGHDFVHQQRLSALKQTVVVDSDIDDPLVLNPIELSRWDYQNGMLIFYLSRPINEMWAQAFRKPKTGTSVMNKGPETFVLQGNEARISASEHNASDVLKYFKEWLAPVNQAYAEMVRYEKAQKLASQREELRRKVEQEEMRNRILDKLKP